jgi:hypothetical protein
MNAAVTQASYQYQAPLPLLPLRCARLQMVELRKHSLLELHIKHLVECLCAWCVSHATWICVPRLQAAAASS